MRARRNFFRFSDRNSRFFSNAENFHYVSSGYICICICICICLCTRDRFVIEFGTRKMAARPFLRKAADKLPAALAIFEERIARWVNATDATGQIKP